MKSASWLLAIVTVALATAPLHAQVASLPSPSPAATNAGPSSPRPSSAVIVVSPGAADVLKLVDSGVGDEVVLAFIQNRQTRYNLSADEILNLGKAGLKPNLITAMLQHDRELPVRTNVAPPGPVPMMPAPVPPETQAPPPDLSPPVRVSNPPIEVGYFYADLVPYGAWVRLEDIGWCWQPRAAALDHDWKPYCQGGHWVDTEAGWFWQSDYVWGTAPFHYGRWQLHDHCGWVWQPDTVWGPAWVTWRIEDSKCGWAALPPRASFDAKLGYQFNGVAVNSNCDFGLRPEQFTFVDLKYFQDHDLSRRHLPLAEVQAGFANSQVLNNYAIDQETVVNRGVAVAAVAAATGAEVKRFEIREVPAGSKPWPVGRSETLVFHPRLLAGPRVTGMFAQKIDAQHPTIQHRQISAPKDATKTALTNQLAAPKLPAAAIPKIEPSGEFRELARINENRRTDVLPPYSPPPPNALPRAPVLSVPVSPVSNGARFLPRTYSQPTRPATSQPPTQ